MPNEQELAIILKFRDLATSQLNQAVGNATRHINELGQKMQIFSRQMRQVGSNLIFLGAAITGPFVLSLRTASQYIPSLRDSLRATESQFKDLQITIGQALVPVIQNFASLLQNLKNWFDNLDLTLRNSIIQWTFLGGVLITLTGTVILLGSKLVYLSGALFRVAGALAVLNPAFFSIVTIAIILITLFGVWESVIKLVSNAIIFLINTGRQLIEAFLLPFKLAVAGIILILEKFLELLGKLPDKLGGKFFRDLAQDAKELRIQTFELATQGAENVLKFGEAAFQAMTVGAPVTEEMIAKIKELTNQLKELTKAQKETVRDLTFMQDLKKFWAEFTDVSQKSASIIKSGIMSLESKFASIFERIITEGGKAKEIFAEFGKAILTTIVQMIAKFLAFIATVTLIAGILSAFGVPPGVTFKAAFKFLGAFAKGGIVPNVEAAQIPAFQHGGEVLAGVTPGEFIVNPEATRHNRALLERINRGESPEQVPPIIINIQAIDVKSFRDRLAENPDIFEASIINAIEKSRTLRHTIRNRV